MDKLKGGRNANLSVELIRDVMDPTAVKNIDKVIARVLSLGLEWGVSDGN